MQREADTKIKESLVKVLLHDLKVKQEKDLERELLSLPLPELLSRAAKRRIQFKVEDEDAWAHGGELDHTSMEDTNGFLTEEEKQMMEKHRLESQIQVDTEKRALVRLIIDAEIGDPTWSTKLCISLHSLSPRAEAAKLLEVQRHCCAELFPWCEKRIAVTFDEDGPLGIKFAPSGNSVKVVGIKEHYQADENHRVKIGLVLREIDGKEVGSSSKQHVLGMLHAASRPITMLFVPDVGAEEQIELTDSEDDENTNQEDTAGGEGAFWDDEEMPEDQMPVEDIESPAVESDAEDILLPQQEVEEASQALREYGAALVARQHLADAVESMAAAIDEAARSVGGTKTAMTEKDRQTKMRELAKARMDLTAADKSVDDAATSAGYSFEKCTVHVESVPDSLGHDAVQSLFSVFGRVLQVTLQHRPGINSNWALVTLCDVDSVRHVLSAPREFKNEPTDDQQMHLRRVQTLQASKMYASSYGHSWLEANERAEATIRGLALSNDSQVRNDFGVFVTTAHSKHGDKSTQAVVPRRRAPVCERRRQVAAQMRVCETAVDALFYACDHDGSGTLDREELALLMAELNGGPRVSEFAVQFVMDQVQSHGDGAITREELKPAITLWRYLQHEQDFVAQEFDAFDKRTKGKIIGKNEVGLLLKRLNSDKDHPAGIPPAVAEVEWVMSKAQKTGNGSSSGGVDRAELRAAVALWYPFVYNRRRVEDLPSSSQSKAGRRRRAIAGMLGVHKHHVGIVLAGRYPITPDPDNPGRVKPHELTVQDLGLIMCDLISTPMRREQVSKDEVEYLALTADLQGAEHFEPEDIKNALAMWLCTREVQADLDASLGQYDDSKTGADQRRQVHGILTELNDGIPVTWAETDWVLESSDIDGNGTVSRDEMRASIGWWFLHVARRDVAMRHGWEAMLPWLCSAMIGLICAYLVAATSVRFTEEKTQQWLRNSAITLLVKQFVQEPLKVVLCGCCCHDSAISRRMMDAILAFSLDGDGEHDGGTLHDDSGHSIGVDSTDVGTDESHGQATPASVFLIGSTGAKLKGIANRGRVKQIAVQAATDAARDSQRTLQRMQSQRAEMNAVYAQKVADKRLKKGLNRGTFAARAEVDMIAVSQFMAAEQENTKVEERTVLAEIKELDEQEEALLATPATSSRGEELKRIRNQRARAEVRRRTIAERRGDLEHQEGNEKQLLAKAQREGEDHARHISHLEGLASAKTRERVRRKRDAKKGVAVQEDAGVALRRSRWAMGRQGKGALGLAKMMVGGARLGQSSGRVAVREEPAAATGPPVDGGEMTSIMLAEAGMRRSATRPKQLKVIMPSEPLPGAAAPRSLIDEVNEIRDSVEKESKSEQPSP